MVEDNNNRFRLRNGDEIVGYLRQLPNGPFFSKDEYAWNGQAIPFEQKDRWTGLRDTHQKNIYTNDILWLQIGGQEQHVLVDYDEALQQFSLIDFADHTLVHPNASVYLSNKPFRRLAYNFKQELP